MVTSVAEGSEARAARPAWLSQLKPYGRADRHRAISQVITSLGPYAVLWAAMIIAVRQGWPLPITVGLALVAAGFQIRIFIIFHDCCHGSFFASRSANRFWGYVTGILTLTPFDVWRQSHARHHATAGDLDSRGTGDVSTMTVAELTPIISRLSDDVVLDIYKNTSSKKRKFLLSALGDERAAAITNRLISKEGI